jgi:hypothetical protein
MLPLGQQMCEEHLMSYQKHPPLRRRRLTLHGYTSFLMTVAPLRDWSR